MQALVLETDNVDALLLWGELDVVQSVRHVDDLAQGRLAARRSQHRLHVERVSAWRTVADTEWVSVNGRVFCICAFVCVCLCGRACVYLHDYMCVCACLFMCVRTSIYIRYM